MQGNNTPFMAAILVVGAIAVIVGVSLSFTGSVHF